eukprot:1321403-Amphidinium_carterae.1
MAAEAYVSDNEGCESGEDLDEDEVEAILDDRFDAQYHERPQRRGQRQEQDHPAVAVGDERAERGKAYAEALKFEARVHKAQLGLQQAQQHFEELAEAKAWTEDEKEARESRHLRPHLKLLKELENQREWYRAQWNTAKQEARKTLVQSLCREQRAFVNKHLGENFAESLRVHLPEGISWTTRAADRQALLRRFGQLAAEAARSLLLEHFVECQTHGNILAALKKASQLRACRSAA